MIRKILFTFAASLLSVCLYAQYTSLHGRFQVNQISGCPPLNVTLTIIPPSVCNGANPCDMDWNGDNNYDENLVFNHIYNQPGTYWLQVLFQASGVDSIQIEVLPNIPPTFEIYTCGGNSAQYNITDTNYDEYVLDFNDGSPVAIVPPGGTGTHTFPSPGSKIMTLRGRNVNAQDNCAETNLNPIAVATLPAPTLTELRVLDDTQIQLLHSGQDYIQYRLEMAENGTGSFLSLQNIYNNNTILVPNLQTEDNYYCFRLGAYDPCIDITYYSNTICSADLNLNVQSDVNILIWNTANAGIVDYAMIRDGSAYAVIPNTSNVFNDTDVVCDTDYTYQLISNYGIINTFNVRSYSLEETGTAISTTPPTPVQNITTIVDQNSVILEWDQDPAYAPAEYSILKSSVNYTAIGTSASQTFTDTEYSNDEENPVCYRITYTDLCDNQSTSIVDACPIQLNGVLGTDNSVILNWSDYDGWQSGVQNYTIEKYADGGTLLQTIDAGTSVSFTDNVDDPDNQIYVYVIRATSTNAALNQSVSNTIRVVKDPKIFYPTAFTPNGDDLNDYFHVSGQYIVDFRMNIFSRWGELIFSTEDISQGWDGRLNGKLVEEGTYVFNADLTDQAGRSFNRAGPFVLLRKQ